MRRTRICLAAAALMAPLLMVVMSGPAKAANPYNVYVGYADDLRATSAATSPTPWAGDPGVNFQGVTTGLDAGAIRVSNASGVSETVDYVKANFSGCVYDLWPHGVVLPAGGQLIVTQTVSGAGNGCAVGVHTAPDTMDSSDFGPNGAAWAGHCNQSGVIPQVTVSVNGVATTYADSGQVLNTGGVDGASCPHQGIPAGNETTQWVSIGQPPCPSGAALALSPSTQTDPVGSSATVTAHFAACGSPLEGATVRFTVTAGPHAGVAGTGVVNSSGDASFSYPGLNVGSDTVVATVTNVAGTITSNSVSVVWVKASPTLSTQPSGSAPAGGSVSDTATLAGGVGPTGTITFKLYGPGDTGCANAIAMRTATVTGNGAYGSGPVVAAAPGTYRWTAAYGGDGSNNPATSLCGAESVVVTPQTLTGRAYGLSAQTVLASVLPTPDTGPVMTTSSGTVAPPCVATVSSAVVNAQALCASVTTAQAPGASSTAQATVANAGVGLPLLPAVQTTDLTARSQTTCAGSSGAATIGYLRVGGTVLVPTSTTPPPNTTLNVAGIKVILNEQMPIAGGLTVNAVHVIVPGVADVVVASATSDIHNCP